jgi:hypothetical protein
MKASAIQGIALFRVLSLAVVLSLPIPAAWGQSNPDLPPCDQIEPGGAQVFTLGIIEPDRSQDLARYAAQLTTAEQAGQLRVCAENWAGLLPRWVPWNAQLERGHGFVLFLLAFAGLAALLARFTPRRWWRRPTALGIVALLGGGWLLGVLGLALFHGLGGQRLLYASVVSLAQAGHPPQWHEVSGARELDRLLQDAGWVKAGPLPAGEKNTAEASSALVTQQAGTYRVHHPLNLRQAAGVAAIRDQVLQAGVLVEFSGVQQGDWWQVKTREGREGWVSSLWLRRPEESGVMVGAGDVEKGTGGL